MNKVTDCYLTRTDGVNFLHMWMEKMQGRWNMIIHAAQKNVVL